jgi:pimeloyl-ACP methyl ester carboxylesterase
MDQINKIECGKYKIHSVATGNPDKAIIFVHGNSQTHESWNQQLSDSELKNKYKLITFDLPGHGQSDWFDADDVSLYSLKGMTKALETVIGFYHPHKYILVGLSYGTNMVAELENQLPNCKGIVLAGAHILDLKTDISLVLKTVDAPPVTAMPECADEDLEKFSAYLSKNDNGIRQTYINTFRKTDPMFRNVVGKTIMGREWSHEPLNLARNNIPTIVVFGRKDAFIYTEHLENYKSVWQPEVIFVEESGHMVNQEKPKEFNKILLAFADTVFK